MDLKTQSESEVIKEVAKFRDKYEQLPPGEMPLFRDERITFAMVVNYIHHLNTGELVGTQMKEETREVLLTVLPSQAAEVSLVLPLSCNECHTAEVKETMNTYAALMHVHSLHHEMENTGLLTVQQVCDINGLLLKGIHHNAGVIRKTYAYTNWYHGRHFYPSPEVVEEQFYALIDRHNMRMNVRPHNATTEEDTAYVFNAAARLLFDFVDTHPFSDGNGRTCRLLANYVLSLITPFPVGLNRATDKGERNDYLDAIVHCREHPEEGPCRLAAMLLENALQGWKCLFLERETL